MHFSNKLIIAAVLAVVAIGGSAAYAAIPDAAGVIHACYNNSSGALRVLGTNHAPKSCSVTETALNWNQQGPAPTPPPPRNVIVRKTMMNGYFAYSGQWAVVDTLALPAPGPQVLGAYQVTVKLDVADNVSQFVGCEITPQYNGVPEIDEAHTQLHNGSDQTELVLNGAVAGTGAVELRCYADSIAIGYIQWTATPVDNITDLS
jgi:hypothetical protein